MATLKEIIVEYANKYGGGLPLSPQEMCNAIALWVQNEMAKIIGEEVYSKLIEDIPSVGTENGSPIKVSYNDEIKKYIIGFNTKDSTSIQLGTEDLDGEDSYGLLAEINQDWLIEFIQDNFFNAIEVSDLFEGSDTIVVDLSEDSQHIEIHLDADVVNKIERAILTPMQAPTEDSVPVVGQGNAVRYEPLSSLGGGGTSSYLHHIAYDSGTAQVEFILETSRSEAFSNAQEIIDYVKNVYSTTSGQIASTSLGIPLMMCNGNYRIVGCLYTLGSPAGAPTYLYYYNQQGNSMVASPVTLASTHSLVDTVYGRNIL